MKVLVSSLLKVDASELTPDQVDQLVTRYTATPDPDSTWGETASIRVATTAGKFLLLPRGQLLEVLTYLREAKHKVEVNTDGVSAGVPLRLVFRGRLHPYQQPVEAALLTHPQGFVTMPCGAGKTVTAISAAAAAGRSFLVLVHTKELFWQWFHAVQRFLGIVPGQMRGNRTEIRPITVAMVQTLAHLEPASVVLLGRHFGLVITDEIQHMPAASWYRVQNLLSCRNRWGLSATPCRPDGLHVITQWVLGPQLAEVTYAELIAGGWLLAPDVFLLPTEFGFEEREGEDAGVMLSRLGGELAADPGRNELIVRVVATEQQARRSTLVLVDRIVHARKLAALLSKAGVPAYPITSRDVRSVRKAVLKAFVDGRLQCLVATQLADEGLDVPRLEALVLVSPGKSANRCQQRAGRLMRRFPGKRKPHLHDLTDERVRLLVDRTAKRLAVYRNVLQVEPRRIEP